MNVFVVYEQTTHGRCLIQFIKQLVIIRFKTHMFIIIIIVYKTCYKKIHHLVSRAPRRRAVQTASHIVKVLSVTSRTSCRLRALQIVLARRRSKHKQTTNTIFIMQSKILRMLRHTCVVMQHTFFSMHCISKCFFVLYTTRHNIFQT